MLPRGDRLVLRGERGGGRRRLERNEDYDVGADDDLGAVLEESDDGPRWEALSVSAEARIEGRSDDD